MTDLSTRNWVAEIGYDGLKKFRMGTFFFPVDYTQYQVERGIMSELEGILPAGYRVYKLVPGQLILVPE